jgi:hypothetical protein
MTIKAHPGFAGTWQLNRERSSLPAVTKSQLLVIETDGVDVAMHETLVNDRDETLTITMSGRFDGQDYPVTGTAFADTVSYRLLGPDTIEGAAKKDGTVVVTETAVLSADEKTIHVTYVSVDAEGKTVTHDGLFDRVDEP